MTTYCDLHLHFGGKWLLAPKRHYIGGNVDIQVKYDIDLLSHKDIKDRYKDVLGCKDIKHLYYLEMGKSFAKGLMLLEGDKGIRLIMAHVIEGKGDEIHIYPFEVNDLPFSEDMSSTKTSRYVHLNLGCRTGENADAEEYESIEIPVGARENWHSVEITEANEGQNISEGPEDSDESDDNEEGDVHVDTEEYESDYYEVMETLKANEEVIKRQMLNTKLTFELGQTFANAKAFRLIVAKYAIQEGCPLNLIKSDKARVRYHCEPSCPFKLYAVKEGERDGLVLRTFIPSHNCTRQYNNPRVSALVLAEYFKEKIRGKPKYSIRDMKDHAKETLELNVTLSMCKRAKKLIIEGLDGGYKEEYSCLEAYVNELSISNPGSTFDLQFSKEGMRVGKRIFCRLYLCFNACKKGWMDGCRPIIGLDGCFLKDICKGQLLVAVGHDAMDQIYPIAWAVVEKETKVNWEWFLSHLIEDLSLRLGDDITLMSDMQKVSDCT
ncbi:hypothetical protein M5689_021052 [Euphorbia peplus]|nr:hypothetical protein M5689_021052 [Euphorbia peplus]